MTDNTSLGFAPNVDRSASTVRLPCGRSSTRHVALQLAQSVETSVAWGQVYRIGKSVSALLVAACTAPPMERV